MYEEKIPLKRLGKKDFEYITGCGADGAVVYTQAAAPTVDEANKIIYGNGTPLLLKQAVPKAMW